MLEVREQAALRPILLRAVLSRIWAEASEGCALSLPEGSGYRCYGRQLGKGVGSAVR